MHTTELPDLDQAKRLLNNRTERRMVYLLLLQHIAEAHSTLQPILKEADEIPESQKLEGPTWPGNNELLRALHVQAEKIGLPAHLCEGLMKLVDPLENGSS